MILVNLCALRRPVKFHLFADPALAGAKSESWENVFVTGDFFGDTHNTAIIFSRYEVVSAIYLCKDGWVGLVLTTRCHILVSCLLSNVI